MKISTVFLGLDHGWGEESPVLWETGVFINDSWNIVERYQTREAALKGHAEVLKEYAPA